MKIIPYIEEIKSQTQSAKIVLSTNINIFDKYHYFLVHCSIIHKILFPYIDEKELINNKQSEIIKKERTECLSIYFENSTFLNNNQVKHFRNHFEHIDERIDRITKTNSALLDKNVSSGVNILDVINVQGLKKESMLRNYENGNLTFYGETFNFEEAKKWLDSIEEYINLKGLPKEPTTGQSFNNGSFS
jgi:hypothetical protein